MSEKMLPSNVDVAADEKEANSLIQQTEVLSLEKQGKMRWCFEYKNRTFIDKYNSDNVKNVYAVRDKVKVPLQAVAKVALYNEYNRRITDLAVPDGAVVFQRRRVGPVNYEMKFFEFTETTPAYRDESTGKIYPPKTITRKDMPYALYDQVWLIGWRKREVDNSVTVKFKAVYPDGKADTHTSFCVDGSKDWLREPAWFSDEQV